MIVINLDKAKEIYKERLRKKRQPLLEKLDIEFMQAQEKGKDTSLIVKEKDKLRDITKQVDKVKTLDDLKKIHI